MEKDTLPLFPVTQRRWRWVGIVAITLCGLMAWYGADHMLRHPSLWVMVAYWSVFLLLLIVSMIAVLLDIRFIKLQYIMGQRDAFQRTLGSEEFRKALKAAREESGVEEEEEA